LATEENLVKYNWSNCLK